MALPGTLVDRETYAFREGPASNLTKKAVVVEQDPSDPIPVAIVPTSPGDPLLYYDDALSVIAGVSTNVLTYTVPLSKTLLLKHIHMSGTNYGTYTIKVNSVVVGKHRTWWADFSGQIPFFNHEVTTGLVVEVDVLHNSTMGAGDFNATIVGELL